MTEVISMICFQDGKPVDVSNISSFLASDAKFVLKQARALVKQIKTNCIVECKEARQDRDELIADSERTRSKKNIRDVCASRIKQLRIRRNVSVAQLKDLIMNLKNHIAPNNSTSTKRKVSIKTDKPFAPLASEFPRQKAGSTVIAVLDAVTHIMTSGRQLVEKKCKDTKQWNAFLNKSACGQYWTGVNNAHVGNYILLDKNGDVIRDAKEFTPYYIINSMRDEVLVYCYQDAKFAQNNKLRFNKNGLSSYPNLLLHSKYMYLGKGDQMKQALEQPKSTTNGYITLRTDDRKWVPALLRFSRDVYGY